jgi:hypothetical protein
MSDHDWLAAYWLFVNTLLAGLGALVHRRRWLEDKASLVRCRADPDCDPGVERVLLRGEFNNSRRTTLKALLMAYALVRVWIVETIMLSPVKAEHWVDAIIYTSALLWAYKWSLDARKYD